MNQMERRQSPDGGPAGAAEAPAEGALVAGAGGAPGDVAGVSSRRRGKALEAAIFEAALDQLTSGGFARMTMEGIAGAAQTGKAALYRRWASKADLIIDALGSTLPPPAEVPDLGAVRSELLHLIQGYGAVMESPVGAAMRALMAELDIERTRDFQEFLTERVMRPATAAMLDVLRRGELRGDVRPGAATSLVADVGPAMLLYRAKICDGAADPEFCVALVDEVLLPMVRP